MITAMSLTNGTLTVIRDNGAEILTARNDHPRWNEIVEAYKTRNEDRLTTLLSLKAVVEEYSVGQLTINATGVLFRGHPLHSVDASRVMAFLRDGLPYKPIANYIARKFANPSARAITELYSFLEHKNMPITDEGKIIAYKGVQDDFFSVMGNTTTVVLQGEVNSGGHIRNVVGATIEIERSSCDDDFRNGCSFGLHAGSLSYAKGWGKRVVLVEIDPADVVSVPEDCNCQKLRCCKYRVLGEYTGPMPHTYSNEFGSSSPDAPTETDDSDDQCSGCGNHNDDCSCYDPCSCGQSGCPDCDSGINAPDPQTEVAAPVPVAMPTVPNNEARDSIAKKLRAIIAEQLIINESDIKDDSLLTNLGMDSLDSVELVMALEEEFNREIGDNEAEEIGSKPFSAIVDYIYQQNPSGVVDQTPTEDPYMKGMQEGVRDRAQYRAPRYLAGDQEGADSEAHAKFIDGYVNGYAQ
jgi:acyl carrier protein